jgi:hypothetical protein
MIAWLVTARGGRRPPPEGGRRLREAVRGAVRVSSGSSKNDTLLLGDIPIEAAASIGSI